MIRVYYVCTICGETFDSQYYKGGSIEHENETSDHNMTALIIRYNESKRKNRPNLFIRDIKDCKVIDCRIKWLYKHGYVEIANEVSKLVTNRLKKETTK